MRVGSPPGNADSRARNRYQLIIIRCNRQGNATGAGRFSCELEHQCLLATTLAKSGSVAVRKFDTAHQARINFIIQDSNINEAVNKAIVRREAGALAQIDSDQPIAVVIGIIGGRICEAACRLTRVKGCSVISDGQETTVFFGDFRQHREIARSTDGIAKRITDSKFDPLCRCSLGDCMVGTNNHDSSRRWNNGEVVSRRDGICPGIGSVAKSESCTCVRTPAGQQGADTVEDADGDVGGHITRLNANAGHFRVTCIRNVRPEFQIGIVVKPDGDIQACGGRGNAERYPDVRVCVRLSEVAARQGEFDGLQGLRGENEAVSIGVDNPAARQSTGCGISQRQGDALVCPCGCCIECRSVIAVLKREACAGKFRAGEGNRIIVAIGRDNVEGEVNREGDRICRRYLDRYGNSACGIVGHIRAGETDKRIIIVIDSDSVAVVGCGDIPSGDQGRSGSLADAEREGLGGFVVAIVCRGNGEVDSALAFGNCKNSIGVC